LFKRFDSFPVGPQSVATEHEIHAAATQSFGFFRDSGFQRFDKRLIDVAKILEAEDVSALLPQICQCTDIVIDGFISTSIQVLEQFTRGLLHVIGCRFGFSFDTNDLFEFGNRSVGGVAQKPKRFAEILGFRFVDPKIGIQNVRSLFSQVDIQSVVAIVFVDQL